MTKLIYYDDAYIQTLTAKVVKVEDKRVLLDQTIFFPATSTEPGDIGKVNGLQIIGLKKEGQDVWHIFNKAPTFKVGDEVTLELDWGKRYKAIRLHSSLHLLGSIFEARFKERAVAGVVKSESAYLVFKRELPEEELNEAINTANQDIAKGLEITTYWDAERPGFRWCKVGEYAPIPDGGLHVKNTTEIVNVKVQSKESEDGRYKVVFAVEGSKQA